MESLKYPLILKGKKKRSVEISSLQPATKPLAAAPGSQLSAGI